VSHAMEWNYVAFRKMDGTVNHHVKWNKPDWERQISHVLFHVCNLVLNKKKQWHEWWKPVGEERLKGEVEGGWILLRYFILCIQVE
jgi:hypothetical protein